MSVSKDQTLLLIDCFALIHRAYHAFPPSLQLPDGTQVNAVYGFTSLLLEVLNKFSPSHVVAVFDAPGPTVRHQDYGQYKAHREKPDDDFLSQLPLVEQVLKALDIPLLSVKGFEADDVIGTIDRRHSGKWARTIIVTGDKDLFQLVDEDTLVYLAGSSFSQSKLYGREEVKEKIGVTPEYVIDLKALQGDPSDNIPGVRGIGPKGAVDMISAYGHLDNVLAHVEELPNRYKEKVMADQEMAQLSRKLATIITDVPVSFDFNKDAEFGTFQADDLETLLVHFQFNSLRGKLGKLVTRFAKSTSKEATGALSLFSEPEESLPKWSGEFKSDTVFLYAKYTKEKDPLTWEVEKVLVMEEDGDIYEVEDLSKLVSALEGLHVVTADAKALLHVVKNLGLELSASIYDIGISAVIYSAGRAKGDVTSTLTYYEVLDRISDKGIIKGIESVYRRQQEEKEQELKLGKLASLEHELLPLVVNMERNGVNVEEETIAEYAVILQKKIKSLEQEIYTDVGHEFNISSPRQVGDVLFGELGLPGGKKTKSGGYSTDVRILTDLIGASPVVEKLLLYRELTKLDSTYIRTLPTFVNPSTKRIHAQFDQLGAVTGRFSSKNPNMQNIPQGESIEINLRKAFVATKGTVLVSFDYSQQELRLLAALSGDPTLRESFKAGEDIHARTASEIFGVELSKVTKEQRRVGKTINFGVIYGMSAFGFADRLKVSKEQAQSFINKYFERYATVEGYYKKLVAEGKHRGFVETILGRRRTTVDLSSPNFRVRSAAEREIMNFPLQGSASDIMKLGMIAAEKVSKNYPAKLILQVHDELIYEYETNRSLKDTLKDKEFLKFAKETKASLLDVLSLEVPLEVSVEVGHNWGELSEISI